MRYLRFGDFIRPHVWNTKAGERPKLTHLNIMNSLIDFNKYTGMKRNSKHLAQYMEFPSNILGFPVLLK